MRSITDFFRRKNKKILGIEINEEGFSAVLVQTENVTHILGVVEKNLPAETMSNFLLLASQIAECVKAQQWQFSQVAVAVKSVKQFILPLRDISDTEMVEVIHHEMETTWGLFDKEYVCDWYRKNENTLEVTVGVLSKKFFDFSVSLAQGLQADLVVVTGAKAVSLSDKLVCDIQFAGDDDKTIFENKFGGAIYSTLVGQKIRNGFNFCLRNLPKGLVGNRDTGWYSLATKIAVIFLSVCFMGLSVFYGVSLYQVKKMEQYLAPLQIWDGRYEHCLQLEQQAGKYKNLLSGIKKKYLFRTEQVEAVLDCLPDFDAEIISLRLLSVTENKVPLGYLEIEGKMAYMKDLQNFITALKQIKAFDKVNLQTNKNLPSGNIGFTLRLRYAKIL